MTSRVGSILVCAALGACHATPATSDAPTAGGCEGGTGLHVVVDLSAPLCHSIVPGGPDWSIAVGLEGRDLDKTSAEHVRGTYDPNRIDLLWRWPADATDGLESRIAWQGSGEGQTQGAALVNYQIDVDRCVEVTLVPQCTVGTDAGVPDAVP